MKKDDELSDYIAWKQKGIIPLNWWNLTYNPEKCKQLSTSSQDGVKATPDDWFETWEWIQLRGGRK